MSILGGNPHDLVATTERVSIPGIGRRIVYVNKRKTKYVRVNKRFVSLKRALKAAEAKKGQGKHKKHNSNKKQNKKQKQDNSAKPAKSDKSKHKSSQKQNRASKMGTLTVIAYNGKGVQMPVSDPDMYGLPQCTKLRLDSVVFEQFAKDKVAKTQADRRYRGMYNTYTLEYVSHEVDMNIFFSQYYGKVYILIPITVIFKCFNYQGEPTGSESSYFYKQYDVTSHIKDSTPISFLDFDECK